jgi:hypothetical protein
VAALLGVSAYTPAPVSAGLSLDSPEVAELRERFGGQLSPVPRTRARWYLADLETAQYAADNGDLSIAAQLCNAMRGDGALAGLLGARTRGLVRLRKKFSGAGDQVAMLEGRDGGRSIFDAMFPTTELALLASDGVLLGVGVGELLPVEGRDYPVFVRLDPEWLRFRHSENRWYYNSTVGPLPITPGDGRWVLHVAGGRQAPWKQGLWLPLGRSFIKKQHAELYEANWEGKLANSARVAEAPEGATEEQHQTWFRQVMAWGVNTVFASKPGYSVKLLESNGIGYQSFGKTIDRSEREYMIALAGQIVTATGGAGFANADIHKSIRADIIQGDGEDLSHTVSTQGIPPFVVDRWGEEGLEDCASVEWDVTPPADLKVEAESLGIAVETLGKAREELGKFTSKKTGKPLQPDVTTFASRFSIPIAGDDDGDGAPEDEEQEETDTSARGASMSTVDLQRAAGLTSSIKTMTEDLKVVGLKLLPEQVEQIFETTGLAVEPIPNDDAPLKLDLAPTDVAKVVKVDEARRSQGLTPIGDDRGDKMISELEEDAANEGEPSEEAA